MIDEFRMGAKWSHAPSRMIDQENYQGLSMRQTRHANLSRGKKCEHIVGKAPGNATIPD